VEPSGDVWIAQSEEPLPAAEAVEWAAQPGCGAVVSFSGMVRDHSEGRPGVFLVEYEAYVEHVERVLGEVAEAARKRWPEIGRVALLHRFGALRVGEVSVLVAVSAPHRAEAFEASQFCIDTIKETVPIWKREHWSEGADWSTCSTPSSEPSQKVVH
jgi:molybdopterin synthase catalytic subunit